MPFSLIDLFAGTGAFSKGFENSTNAEYRTVFCNDLLPIATQTAQANHPDARCVAGDIRKLRRSQVAEAIGIKRGDLDVIIGGPPCQGFSSIRPFRSSLEDDPRNSLFEEFASFVNYFRPRAFIIENVVGLATHRDGMIIEAMQTCFDALGYDSDWRILNAANYGIPQRRERLIFIGLPRGTAVTFPPPTHKSNGSTIGLKDRCRMMRPADDSLFSRAPVLDESITVDEAIGDLPSIGSGEESLSYDKPPQNAYQAARRKSLEKLTLHGSTGHTAKMLEIIKHSGPNINSIPPHLISSGFSSCYSRLAPDSPAVTITVNFVHPASNRCIHPHLDRALTPREGARLQSFDDDFIFKGNRSQIVKQIGNAVPPLLGKVIGEHVASLIA